MGDFEEVPRVMSSRLFILLALFWAIFLERNIIAEDVEEEVCDIWDKIKAWVGL